MNGIEKNILHKLEKELNPTLIEIKYESHLHANHNPSAKEGGTHFKIKIVSKKFKGKSRIERHRMVNNILEDEFKKGLHALTLSLSDVE